MPLLSNNPLWEQFATRTLFMTSYGGADFGECQVTMERIGDDGDTGAWHAEWTATADRIAEAAAASEAGGHEVSARESYLRAAVYPAPATSRCMEHRSTHGCGTRLSGRARRSQRWFG